MDRQRRPSFFPGVMKDRSVLPTPARRAVSLGLAVGAAVMLGGGLGAGSAAAHELRYEVEEAEGLRITFSYPYGEPPIFETYRVHAPDGNHPWQIGRTNARGELFLRPDEAGEWRVELATEDGHGVDLLVDVDETRGVTSVRGPGLGFLPLLGAGLGYVLGAMGLLLWWLRRREAGGHAPR